MNEAILSFDRPIEKSFEIVHITQLFLPLRALIILKRYPVDVPIEKRIMPVLGQLIHALFEKEFSKYDSFIAEKELVYNYNDFTLIGRPDLYDKEKNILYDFKLSFTKKTLDSIPDHWKLQLNIYSHLWYPNADLKIILIKPQSLDIVPIKAMASSEIFGFLDTKLTEINYWKTRRQLPECPDEENWRGHRCQFCFAEKICKRRLKNAK